MFCHEVWEYDNEKYEVTLVDFKTVCPACSDVIHFGNAQVRGVENEAFEHLMKINDMSSEEASDVIDTAYKIWELQNEHEWTIKISEELVFFNFPILENIDFGENRDLSDVNDC